MMRATVVLFDIDGTLINSGGAGRRAMERALSVEVGLKDVCQFRFNGLTDPAIVRSALRIGGQPSEDRLIDAVIARYLMFLAEELSRCRFRVLDGVLPLLEQLLLLERVAVGIGTGNVRRGAELKLERGRLARRFDFGGYGSDAEARAELIRIGAERGAARLGLLRAQCRVVVVGDTRHDAAAALASEADCVAVATGGEEPAALLAAGAAVAFETLADSGVLEAVLGAEHHLGRPAPDPSD